MRRGIEDGYGLFSMSQQPNYGQHSMSDNSWDLVNKAAAVATSLSTASAEMNDYNGYPVSAAISGGAYHRSPMNNSNGSHYGSVHASPNSAVVQQWHGVRLPTAPSSSSGTPLTVTEQWLAAQNHLQQHHQNNLSGMNLSSAMIAPSSNAAAAAAAAQLYSGNATSYFGTGGGDAGKARQSILPPPPAGQAAAVLSSPTSPMLSPTSLWPGSTRSDSILAKQHQFHLPQTHPEQRSPQQHHLQNIALAHGLHERASPHYQQPNAQHSQQYQAYQANHTPASSPAATSAAVSSYEKLLEAVAIQAARVPLLNQQQSQASALQYHADTMNDHQQRRTAASVGSSGAPTSQCSSLLELDILRNLAATAGGASGHNVPKFHRPSQQHQEPLRNYALKDPTPGSNGYGNAFRPPLTSVTVKREPSFYDVASPPTSSAPAPAPAPTMPSSELDVARTMLTIQTCSIQNTVAEYQQISPATDDARRTPSKLGLVQKKSDLDENETNSKVFAAITIETQQDESDNSNQPAAKRLRICTSSEDVTRDCAYEGESVKETRNVEIGTERNRMSGDETRTVEDVDSDDKTLKRSPGVFSENAKDSTEEISPALSHSSPSNDTPVSGGGRTDSFGSRSRSSSGNDSSPDRISNLGPTATVMALNCGSTSIDLPVVSAALGATISTPTSTVHPPGFSGPSPFGAFTAQHAANHAHLHTCQICGFASPSKFHYNSHMNTHADHKCDFCDYTSRTEGRLKKHMKEFHSPPQVSGANSNDESSSHALYPGSGGHAQFDQSLEEQLQAVVASMTSGGGSGSAGSSFGRLSTTPPSSKPGSSGSANKSKTYRCKQCDFVGKVKNDYWAHVRSHIKSDKLLSCPNCPFVTEYKHHLEYHLRNHFGSKPFKCVKCNYSCVNKSMLNSHMKSHSNFYQYRCADCTYATKYCHSLKLHLRKYAHQPATTVTPDGGTVVDGTAIDVYGNRRGPRTKKLGENGSRNGGGDRDGPRSMVSSGGPISASLPIASPSHIHNQTGNGSASAAFPTSSGLLPTMTLAESLNQHAPTMVAPTNVQSGGTLTPSFMEALQNSLLAQQQKDITAAMVTSIATLGAQLPTIPSLAAVLAAAQNQPGNTTRSPSTILARPTTPSPSPLGSVTPVSMTNSAYQLSSPISCVPPSLSQSLKCNLCEFSCANKETLTKHTMIHMMEKPEQFYQPFDVLPSLQVYNLMASAAVQAQAVAAAAAALGANCQQSTSGSSCASTPADELIKSEVGLLSGGVSSAVEAMYDEIMANEQNDRRYLTSHDVSQDSGGSPASVSGEKVSGDEGTGNEMYHNVSSMTSMAGHRQRRKGRAFKLDRIALKLQGKSCDDADPDADADLESTTEANVGEYERADHVNVTSRRHTRSTSPAAGGSNQSGHRVNRSESVSSVSGIGRPNTRQIVCTDGQSQLTQSGQPARRRATVSPSAYPTPVGRPTNIDWSNAYVCNYCEIAFKDCIMYTMHMGFHGYQDPYKCNTCGHLSDDPRSMFLHIAREPHL